MTNQQIQAAHEELSRAALIMKQALLFEEGCFAQGDQVRLACQVARDASFTAGAMMEEEA